MAMARRSESYSGGAYGGSSYGAPYGGSSYGGPYGGSSYGGSYEEPYQVKRSKNGKSGSWDVGMQDPEMKRKKRVASYKVYTIEGKMKASVRSSWRWIKNKYIDIRYGWW